MERQDIQSQIMSPNEGITPVRDDIWTFSNKLIERGYTQVEDKQFKAFNDSFIITSAKESKNNTALNRSPVSKVIPEKSMSKE